MSAAEQPVHLLDASIYIFQAHFSPYVDCVSRRGADLGALYGFTHFLLQFARRTRAAHVAVAHDESLFCGFRHQLCPSYKSNRELPDENLAHQLRGCLEICAVLGFTAYSSRQFEADDIIGVLAARVRAERAETVIEIVSRDKDLAQLLAGEQDSLWDYQKNQRRRRNDIRDQLGIQPEQIPDYLGLVGDAVDCISGVPGVGPVAARELLQRFDCLEDIYARLDEVPDLPIRGARALAGRLRLHGDQAMLSKRLATIVCDMPGSEEAFAQAGMAALERRDYRADELAVFLKDYAFPTEETERLRREAERAFAPTSA